MSHSRRFIVELLATCRGMPIITIERRMRLADLVAARSLLARPPSWVCLFAKAFAIVSARHPELRQSYLSAPWPHLYQTAGTIASIAVERTDLGDESGVYFGQFVDADTQNIAEMSEAVSRWQTLPVEEIREYRRAIRLMRVPWLFRKLVWWYAVKCSGRNRVRHFGTFGISSTAAAGATCRNLIAPVSTTLNYGVFDSEGNLDVRLHFDHRVYDGMPAARYLAELEAVLSTTILAEVRQLAANPPRTEVVGSGSVQIVVTRT